LLDWLERGGVTVHDLWQDVRYGARQWVAERYQEVGIRLALGAGRAEVIRMILSEGMALVGIGVAFGLLVSFAISRAASILLYGISLTDPPTHAGVAGLLAGVALVSSWLPAHRAGQVSG
jgi:putative ABC transport system permease protein